MLLPKLLIITGPQGSGNHLFSKVFSKHPLVYGWRMQSYWEGHHTEPFIECWQAPEKLNDFDWTQSEYYFTSVSSPYFKDRMPHYPNYKEFISEASKYADIKVAIIGRDKNILQYQEQRVRGKSTYESALDSFEYLYTRDPVFISQELYQLYGNNYLRSISKLLDFPIADQEHSEDANTKYIHPIEKHWLDDEVYKAVSQS